MELNTEHSLKAVYSDIKRMGGEGQYLQYDLISERNLVVFECKFHKSISWNEAKKYFHKLITKKPTDYEPYLIFKSNQQPVLVMYLTEGRLTVREFEAVFGVVFEKHKSVKFGKKFPGDEK